jgi:two-component system OmpR family sensor kinase
MFRSLQSRLILSYAAIIAVCLVLVGLASVVLLRGYQRNLVFSRLDDRSTLSARLAAEFLRRGQPPEDVIERLSQQMNRRGQPQTFVYLLNLEGRVLSGSNEKLDGISSEQLPVRPLQAAASPVRGERRLAAGERVLYVAEPVYGSVQQGQRAIAYYLLLAEPYRPVRVALGDLVPRLMWAGAIALILSLVLAALMAVSVARPLDRIAQAAEEIAAGNYDQELDITSPTELARLATSFGVMARRVKATVQSQQDLLANVSHDLKTPLTSIQGFSQAMLDGTASDGEAWKRAATIIHNEAGRMRRLVDDLLDLARLEAGEVALAHEPVDMRELLRACAVRFSPQAEGAGVHLEVDAPALLPEVMGDADRLGKVFGNLVDNALKHASDENSGGRVVLQAGHQQALVVCSVTDNGPGIPAEDLPRIFERFYQVDKSRVRRASGAGLGLAIAKEIVQAHGGQILAESVEGLGTRFTVRLPARVD